MSVHFDKRPAFVEVPQEALISLGASTFVFFLLERCVLFKKPAPAHDPAFFPLGEVRCFPLWLVCLSRDAAFCGPVRFFGERDVFRP